jgi:hypothetical protein
MRSSTAHAGRFQRRQATVLAVLAVSIAVFVFGLAARSDSGRRAAVEAAAAQGSATEDAAGEDDVELTMGLSADALTEDAEAGAGTSPTLLKAASGVIVLGILAYAVILVRGYLHHVGRRRRLAATRAQRR